MVITGDVVVAPIPYGFNSYPKEWISVLLQIHALRFGLLVPGHGRPMRDRIAGDDQWLLRWFKNYWKDPIVSSALREARGEPIVQGAN